MTSEDDKKTSTMATGCGCLIVLVIVLTPIIWFTSRGDDSPSDESKAATVALEAPLGANNPHGKTLGECLDAHGYGTTKKELTDSAQRRKLDDGGTVYRISFYDGDDFLRVGVLLDKKAVGGWDAENASKLETLNCVIDGPHRLNLS